MATFTPLDPASLPGPASLRELRTRALERFEIGPLPTVQDDIWKYSRVADLDVGAFRAAKPHAPRGMPAEVEQILATIGERSALIFTVDGAVASLDSEDTAVHVRTARDGDPVGRLTGSIAPWDAFVELNTAQSPSPIVISVGGDKAVEAPVVVCHWTATDGAVTFPRVLVTTGSHGRVRVIECLLSAPVRAWVDPVTELAVGAGGRIEHVVVQQLGPEVWQTGYIGAGVDRDASLLAFVTALGGEYARVRMDSRILGTGGAAELLALYCGNGRQMHDFRTLQLHEAPKGTSDLVFKGAVQDEARSAYSGLIRVERGAVGTKAFQTNRNLTLSDTGLATYSVPTLDIEENDVSCSHASATGPIDEEQRFYLESRGVPSDVAERLIVLGFFEDLLLRLPVRSLRSWLGAAISTKLGIASG